MVPKSAMQCDEGCSIYKKVTYIAVTPSSVTTFSRNCSDDDAMDSRHLTSILQTFSSFPFMVLMIYVMPPNSQTFGQFQLFV